MIRAVTLGVPVGQRSPVELRECSRDFFAGARARCEADGTRVRTQRLLLPALGREQRLSPTLLEAMCDWASQLCAELGLRWFCVPVDLMDAPVDEQVFAAALSALGRHPGAFFNFMVADERGIQRAALGPFARFVLAVSRRTNNGYDNFRVGASARSCANGAFFPFAHHVGDAPAFSLALETTAVFQAAVGASADLDSTRERVLSDLVPQLRRMQRLGESIESATGVTFAGLDASLAPFPDSELSVGALIEGLGPDHVGGEGTLFLTAFLTDLLREALDRSEVRRVGFNGVMYSVLEDNHLARAASAHEVTIDALKSFSTVCGCGLDMVPLPGDVLPETLEAMTADVAALAVRLDKPLGVRVLPVPGRRVNERTDFNMDFLHDSRVMAPASTMSAPRASGPQTFTYLTRKERA